MSETLLLEGIDRLWRKHADEGRTWDEMRVLFEDRWFNRGDRHALHALRYMDGVPADQVTA